MGTLTGADPAALRAAVDGAADLVVETAITANGRSTWLVAGAGPADGGDVQRSADASLYDGTAGIALAGWAVATALGRDDLATAALGAARHAVSAADRLRGPGLFDGRAGAGHAALEVGDAAGDADLRERGLALLRDAAGAPPGGSDVISGGAGLVLALLAAARRTGSRRLLRGAVRHGEALLAAADRHPWGWAWRVPGIGDDGLCGLAHGAAGVAWALGELATATGDERFLGAVDGARRYERSWYDPARSNWPDLRPDADDPSEAVPFPAFWCHGAAGIGLTRLALFDLLGHAPLAGEAAAALQASATAATRSLRASAVGSLTICHGLGGTILLLLAARGVLGDDEHLDAARWVAARSLDHLGDDPAGWPGGLPGGGFRPGLMTGLAGTMYVLARASDPEAVTPLAVLGDARSAGAVPGPGSAQAAPRRTRAFTARRASIAS